MRIWSQGILHRAEHIQLAAGSSSPLPIVVASHFKFAQRYAANALLTHQRAAANPHYSSEPYSYVTAVLGVRPDRRRERPGMTKDLSRHIKKWILYFSLR